MLQPNTFLNSMINHMLVGSTMLMLAATTGLAAGDSIHHRDLQYDENDRYRAEEWSLDLFGSASIGRSTIKNFSASSAEDDSELGAGAGLTYFFTRNFGLGAEAYSENTTGAFIDSASLNLQLRFPLGQSGFAPYGFGGGGRQFEQDELWFGQLGAGIEYRFNHQIGLFLDARWVLPEETDYYGVARLGLRFAF